MSVNLNAKPVCTTRITNFCASEEGSKRVRLADRLSDPDFVAGSGQYETWNTFAKEFYEFMRPIWIASDNLPDDKGPFQNFWRQFSESVNHACHQSECVNVP